jgi:hypothetical protein
VTRCFPLVPQQTTRSSENNPKFLEIRSANLLCMRLCRGCHSLVPSFILRWDSSSAGRYLHPTISSHSGQWTSTIGASMISIFTVIHAAWNPTETTCQHTQDCAPDVSPFSNFFGRPCCCWCFADRTIDPCWCA